MKVVNIVALLLIIIGGINGGGSRPVRIQSSAIRRILLVCRCIMTFSQTLLKQP